MRNFWKIPTVLQANTEGTGGGAAGATTTQNTDTTAAAGGGATGGGNTAAGSTTGGAKTKSDDGGTPAGTNAEGTAGKETAGKAGAQHEQPKAPEKYSLTIPEGGELYLGKDDLSFIEQVARENDWTDEMAQAEIVAAVERAQAREKTQAEALLSNLKADKDYGGEQLETTQRQAKAAIDRIFPVGHRLREEFLKTFNRPIVGNNLTYVAFLAEVGKLLGEDSVAATRGAGGSEAKSAAEKLYDHPTSKALDSRA